MSIDRWRGDPADLFRLAVEQATDYVIFLLDADARIVSWAPAVRAMFGWGEPEFIGRSFVSLFAEDDVAAGVPRDVLAKAFEQGQARYTHVHLREGGGTFWAHGRIARLSDASGVRGLVVSLQDVTALRQREEEHRAEVARLRARVAEFQTLLNVVPIGIGIAEDAASQRIRINGAFARLLRMPVDLNASLSAPPAERPVHFRVLRDGRELAPDELPLQRAALTGCHISDFEVDVVFDSGDRIRLLEHVAPLLDEQGISRGSVGAFIDVTEYRQLEEQRERLLAAEHVARVDAERANRLKDDFLASLSHEVRTPLNSILGWSEILTQVTEVPDLVRRGLNVIQRNARLQMRLLEDLLDMSRIGAGQLRLESGRVDIVPLVAAAVESVLPVAQTKGVRVVTNLAASSAVVSGDATRLQQVLGNVLGNALKFTPEGGEVLVALERLRGAVQLQVSDTGMGIAAEFLPFAFDRFRQADASTTRRAGGLGLGLSIARHIVELHGGTIAAESAGRQRGTTVTIRLPVDEGPVSVASMPLGRARQQDKTVAADLNGMSVLIVDDDDDSRALLVAMLRSQGAACRGVSSVSAALELLAGEPPDIILTDIGLPERDGYDLLGTLRRSGTPLSRIPVLALTAYARPEDRRRALEAGFDAFLTKPVDVDHLYSAIRRMRG